VLRLLGINTSPRYPADTGKESSLVAKENQKIRSSSSWCDGLSGTTEWRIKLSWLSQVDCPQEQKWLDHVW